MWDLAPILFADSMGILLLEDQVLWARKRDVQLVLANPSQQLIEDWYAVQLPQLLGLDNLYVDVHHAGLYARSLLAKRGFDVSRSARSSRARRAPPREGAVPSARRVAEQFAPSLSCAAARAGAPRGGRL